MEKGTMARNRILLLTAAIALTALLLSACGGGSGGAKGGDTFTLGDAKLQYTGYDIAEDETGNDAIIITYEYTNNGEAPNSMLWAVLETPYQDGTELSTAMIWTDKESLKIVGDSATQEVGPGETLTVETVHTLQDTHTPVTVHLASMEGDDEAEFTIDLE